MCLYSEHLKIYKTNQLRAAGAAGPSPNATEDLRRNTGSPINKGPCPSVCIKCPWRRWGHMDVFCGFIFQAFLSYCFQILVEWPGCLAEP